jgi:hypothetical protein
MALIHRKPPGPAESKDFRAQERFDEDTFRCLHLVGTVTVNIASINGGAVGTFTIPVIGAKVASQHQVALSAPATINAGLVWCGFVSADDEVTVRVHNTTAGAINPDEAVWGARVFP